MAAFQSVRLYCTVLWDQPSTLPAPVRWMGSSIGRDVCGVRARRTRSELVVLSGTGVSTVGPTPRTHVQSVSVAVRTRRRDRQGRRGAVDFSVHRWTYGHDCTCGSHRPFIHLMTANLVAQPTGTCVYVHQVVRAQVLPYLASNRCGSNQRPRRHAMASHGCGCGRHTCLDRHKSASSRRIKK